MRDNGVTISKGIAIILMVLGHASCPGPVNVYLSMMRMPLFFFMSGYCFKEKYLIETKAYVTRRVTGIYWPYLKWSLFFLLIHNLCFHLNIYNGEYGFKDRTSHLYTLSEFVDHAISVITKMSGHEQLLGGFWFLKSLFVGSLIFYVTRRFVNSTPVRMIILLAMTLILSFTGWKLPYFAIGAREALGAFFLMTGHEYKTYSLKWHHHKEFFLAAILFVGIGSLCWPASMLSFTYIKVLPYAITAVAGTLAIFHIGNWIATKQKTRISRFLIYTGGYTFNVLTWHFLSMKLVSLMLIAIYNLPIKRLSEFPVIEEYTRQGWWILYLCAGIGIPILGTYGYHRLKDSIICKTQSCNS